MTDTRSADPHLAEEVLVPSEPPHDRTLVLADPGGLPSAIWRWSSGRQAWQVDLELMAQAQGQRCWTWGRIVDYAVHVHKRLYTRPNGWTPTGTRAPWPR
jgi:hypothetical protein